MNGQLLGLAQSCCCCCCCCCSNNLRKTAADVKSSTSLCTKHTRGAHSGHIVDYVHPFFHISNIFMAMRHSFWLLRLSLNVSRVYIVFLQLQIVFFITRVQPWTEKNGQKMDLSCCCNQPRVPPLLPLSLSLPLPLSVRSFFEAPSSFVLTKTNLKMVESAAKPISCRM